jgi:hypothetical protein
MESTGYCPRKTPPNLPPTSRAPETNVLFTFRSVRIVRKRYAPRSRHDFAVKAKTNVCRVELRWTDQRRVAAPDGARPALRVRQQRHAAFAPSLRGHNNVIDAEVWRKTAWVKLLVQGRRDRPCPRKSMFMPCYTLCASTTCDSVGWAYALPLGSSLPVPLPLLLPDYLRRGSTDIQSLNCFKLIHVGPTVDSA